MSLILPANIPVAADNLDALVKIGSPCVLAAFHLSTGLCDI